MISRKMHRRTAVRRCVHRALERVPSSERACVQSPCPNYLVGMNYVRTTRRVGILGRQQGETFRAFRVNFATEQLISSHISGRGETRATNLLSKKAPESTGVTGKVFARGF